MPRALTGERAKFTCAMVPSRLGRADPTEGSRIGLPASGRRSVVTPLTAICPRLMRSPAPWRPGLMSPALPAREGSDSLTGAGTATALPRRPPHALQLGPAGVWANDLLAATNFQSNGQPQPAQYFLRIADQETQKAP